MSSNLLTLEEKPSQSPRSSRRTLKKSIKQLFKKTAKNPNSLTHAVMGIRGERGNGESLMMTAPREWRASSMQVCGLWPWVSGSATPYSGSPLGVDIDNGSPVGCDPIAWFMDGIINNPSVFILALPGYGKSTMVRHMIVGMNGRGIIPLIPGDLKPDYVELIEAMNGQVIKLAPGRGHINILDPGEITQLAQQLPERVRAELFNDAHQRKLHLLTALISILRKGTVTDREETILDTALTMLEENFDGVPVVQDLLDLIQSRPIELANVALDRGDPERYRDETDNLVASLMSLNGGSRFGDMFSKHTSATLSMDRPAVFDISFISDTQRDVQAAALMACWSTTFASVELAKALADEGLAPNRHYFIALDELWRALRSGADMVDRIDSLTRLNRNEGVGQAMITHTMSDLEALATEAEREKARGFVERAGMVITGALPAGEMEKLRRAKPISKVEADRLVSWADPGSWSRIQKNRATRFAGQLSPRQAPGVGKFMIKVSGRPGLSVAVRLTPSEVKLNNTNKRWGLSAETVDVSSTNEVTNQIISDNMGEED